MYERPSTQLSFGDPSMSKSQAMSDAAQTVGFEATNGFPLTLVCRYSFTPPQLPLRKATRYYRSRPSSEPMAGRHNGDTRFIAS
jgi:hypothetical protein